MRGLVLGQGFLCPLRDKSKPRPSIWKAYPIQRLPVSPWPQKSHLQRPDARRTPKQAMLALRLKIR